MAGSLARFGLIALPALALGALLLFSAGPVWAQAVDYDTDGDNLIEVSNLAQLNAIRHDLDGNGDSTHADYTGAFSNAASDMGCAATCTGYELTTDLDFDTDSSGAVDSSDTYASWSPIGTSASPFVATFDGGGHTILKMTIRASASNVGLFGSTSAAAIIRNLALLAVDIDRATGRPRTDAVGAIVGFNRGRIERSYATGSAQGVERVGGLAGDNQGTIANSYANVTAGGSRYVGGLAGRNHGSAASITNSYTIGSQRARSMVYSTGRGGFDSGIVGSEGGIVGANTGSATISASYWNSQTSSSPWSYAGISPDNLKKTTAQLQSPTGATGIYVAWSAAIWDFGTSSQYPALKADSDGDGTPTAYEFGGQGRSAPEDYDSDDNGLIEVDSLVQLNAIRYDLDGNGAPAAANANDYALAFPNPETGMGCPITATDADDNDCLGYELTADLDFNTDTTGSSAAVIDSSDDYWDGGKGWSPIASESAPYMAVFDGGRHTIANLFINRPMSNMVNFRDANKSNYVGLFASLMSPGEVRHLRLTGVSVTGRGNVGAVVGHITQGTVSHVSAAGAVTAVGSSGGDGQKAGGLVGSAGSASVVIEYSYSTATVTAGDDYAGGLVGESKGEIRASYATGAATATGSYAGGLVGKNDGSGIIKASYATGAASGADHVGGLAGQAVGNILSSYSRGAPSSSSSPAGTNVGGLVGSRSGAGTITNSYWDVTTSGLADDGVAATGEGKTTIELQSPTQTNGYAGIYANWNLDLDSTAGGDDPWDFGTASEYPALKADFNDDGVKSAVDGDFGRQPRSAPVVNNSPTFSDAALSASIDENVQAGRNVGNLMTANDRDGDTLVYSLTGADGVYFAIDPSTAQIKSKFVLDYESKSSYVFQVKAVDPSGGEATMEVTVYLSDESEGATDSVDYDIDSDGLIEVDSLDQLDAMRHDLDGDGVSTNAAYFSNDFTTPAAGMGCPVADHDSDANTPDQPTCTGYELTADLDFNTDTGSDSGGTAVIDASDDYYNTGSGWLPIGDDSSSGGSSAYNATFEGNGYSISNLFISRSSTDDVGLFGAASATSAIRNVGLVDVAVTGSDYTGALIGTAYGAVDSVYSTGSVTGAGDVGGLMGYMNSGGTMQRSYSTASVTGSGDDIGGLVGNNIGTLTASYATGAVTGVDYVGGLVGANSRALNSSDSGSIIASYATGEVSGTDSNVGGLVGVNAGTITNSYWDVTTSTQADDGNAATGVGKTTSQLQSPTQTNGYAGIYANWNLNLDATAGGDDPWDFGTASQYPALKVEWDGDGAATAYEFGRQGRSAPAVAVDYDLDDDGLIEVSDLAQLNAMRWDLNGDGASTDAGYATAFPNPETGMGCPITAADADDNDCLGYELTANLDFDTNGSGTANLGDTYWNGGSGWEPIGTSASRFNTVFDGRGYTISNLFISRGATDYVGLFGAAGAWIRARNVGLEDAAVTGQDNVGILLGETNGEVEFTYTTGSVVGRVRVGGLVGNSGRTGSIETSYSTASVTGTGNYSGGLIGQSNGAVKASYATGAVGGVRAGGLVGRNYYYGAITASYARGAVTGSSVARGLVASNPILFGLPGQPDDTGTVTDSYWDVTTSGIADDNDAATGVGRTTNDLATPEQSDGYAGIYANWNLNLDSTAGGDDPWDFGTASQYPALKADFNRDSVKSAADGDFGRQPRSAPVVAVDYDLDDNNLIEVSTLAQLNAIRHDLDGNGDSTHADYTGAFLNAAADMGCAATCLGYELTADLDFNTDKTGSSAAVVDSSDAYWNGGDGWAPIGSDASASTRYNAVFDGNGHTISNLFISRSSTGDMGLFGSSSATSAIRNVGLESASVTGQNYTGALIGSAFGAVDFAYSTGSVNGSDYVGGLVGYFEGEIQRSYSTAGVTGMDYVGGLVGNATSTAVIKAGYATGAVSGRIGVGGLVGSSDGEITAGYSTGAVTGTGSNVGGLVGLRGGGTITNSYWNTDTSSQTTSSGGVGKTTNDLATPTQTNGYAGIYANWNLNLDATAGGDDPWDFGTASQYPALKADFNGDGVKSAADGDFGRQPRAAPGTVDYDTDGDNLIEVDSLAKLNAIRWDLNGDGASTNAGYATAFPIPLAGMGCAATCTGYELTADLDFDESHDNAITSADAAWWNGGAGWAPIGNWANPFNATFDGGGHAISHLYIRGSGGDIGLFGSAGTAGVIRNLGLENVDIDRSTGEPVFNSVGALVGSNRGAVALSYSTGEVKGFLNVGGLAGDNRGAVTDSYSSVSVTGNKAVGGLAGFNRSSSASITNSYAAGAVSAVSMQAGPAWNAARTKGGLVGEATADATVTAGYWDTQTSAQAASAGGTGQTTNGLQSPTGATGIYGAWAAAIWHFGTASEYPALKYDTNGVGGATWQEFGRQARSAPAQLKDYDLDDDGLIDVDSLAKLNAMRWDLDGNGASTNAGYAAAFPTPETGMGCPVTTTDADDNDCTGYELTADLDFDTHGNDGAVTAADTAYWNGGAGWAPIGSSSAPFAATFDGAGHAISNLFINRGSTDYIGLFRVVGDGGRIRNLGLERVNITGRDFIGAVAGETSAFSGVEAVYVTGAVSGRDLIGGLIGEHHPNASLSNTYSAARVTGSSYVGGLLGYVSSSNATVYYSYARGVVTGGNSGGLLYPSADQYGINGQQTYWDTQTTGQATSNGGTGQTTSNLKTPTGATGIYSDWPTATWDFGTAIQYPALKYDTDGDGAASWQEFGRQPRSAANAAPRFNAAAKANTSPSVAEGTRLVGNYPATDPNGDALTYGKSGENAGLFSFSGAGVLSLISAADHERKSSYRVTLHVRDSKDADGHPDAAWDDEIDLIVRVDDDETESPGAPTGLTANPIAEGLRVGWIAPVRTDQPPVTGYGVEYKLSTATAWTSHPHAGTGTTTQITGLTAGATYNVRVRALSHENPSGWTSANGVPAAAWQRVDYDTDDDGLIEISYLEQLNAMRWDEDGDGAGGGSDYDAAFPDAAPGMGCLSGCTGYELEADLNFDTNGGSGADSGDDYWNGGRGWAPFRYYGTFEGNRHTISNLYVDRPDSDYVGLFSTAGAYAEAGEVRNLGLENVDVTGREYVGGLAGRAYASVRRVYTTGEVNGERYVGGLVGEARGLISETYSKAGVSGKGLESSNVGGLVGYLRLGTVKASYATGDVSGMTWVGGLVGHNSSSDDGGIIAGYATGNLGFGGLEDLNAVPGRWVDGFSSRYYLPYTPTWVGGLVGDSSGPIAASYSTGGHPISLAGYQPGERKDRSRRDLAYMMEVHWKIGGLVGKSYGKQEHDSYWDTVTSKHMPGDDPKWVYGEGKTTEELQSVTGYTGIYANWNVDLDGDGIGDDPWDFGSSAHYPTLKVDWDGDGTPTAYEFGGQGRSLNDHLPSVGTGVFEVTAPENTPSGAPIFGVTLPLAPADASSYNLFVDAQWPDGVSFNIDATTGQLSAMDALDYESRDTYRIGITAVATDGARHSNGIIIRVTDVAEPPGPPTGVTIVSLKGSLEVSWTPPDMTGKPPLRIYEVTYYHDGDKAKIIAAGTTTYTMTHLTPLITYAVRVRARNVDGWGPDSAVVYGTPYWFAPPAAAATGAEPGTQRFRRSAPPPGQPANLRATPQTDGSALVTWDAPAEAGDDAFYRVRRRVDAADGSYQVIARRVEAAGSGGVVAYRDDGNGREAGQRYLYSARAYDGDGKPLGRWTQGVRDNRPPAFTEDSATAFQVAENTASGTDIGDPVAATDPDDGDTLTYLLGGADADHFAIDADSGQLQTSGVLDYESKDSYAVTVIAADGAGLWASLDVTITVTDVDEAPGQPDAPEIINIKETSFRVTWTAPAAGSSAITGYGIQYKLTSEADSAYADAKPTKRGTVTGYNVVNRRGQSVVKGTSYSVRVRAKNAEGWGEWSEAATVTTASPAPPAFADSTLEVSVAENTAAGTAIGSPVTATDPDGDTLTYTLGATADDGHFTIDSKTGQLQTSGALDYENQSSYTVTVTTTDRGGLSDSIAVTVKVTDVADTPPGQPDAPEILNIKQTSFRVTWTAPAAGSSAVTGYGIQYKLSAEADSAYADAKPTKRGTVTGYNVVNRNGQSITAGTSYDVRVRARNAEGWGEWSEAATAATAVTASPDPPPAASPDPPPDTAPANGDEAETDDRWQEEEEEEPAVAAGSYQATAYFVQGRVWIKWDEVDGAKRYTVQKNGRLLPGWFIATAFFDGDVEENTRYEYRVTAYDGKDNVLAVMTAATE